MNQEISITTNAGRVVNFIPSQAIAVVIADEAVLPIGLLYVGVGGNVAVVPAGQSNTVVFKNIASGSFLPVYIVGVKNIAAGTTATDLLVCY